MADAGTWLKRCRTHPEKMANKLGENVDVFKARCREYDRFMKDLDIVPDAIPGRKHKKTPNA
jgi:hypothetical protein